MGCVFGLLYIVCSMVGDGLLSSPSPSPLTFSLAPSLPRRLFAMDNILLTLLRIVYSAGVGAGAGVCDVLSLCTVVNATEPHLIPHFEFACPLFQHLIE